MSLVLENSRPDSESLRMEEDVDDVNIARHGETESPPEMAVEAETPPVADISEPLPPMVVTPEVVPDAPSEERLQLLKDSATDDITGELENI